MSSADAFRSIWSAPRASGLQAYTIRRTCVGFFHHPKFFVCFFVIFCYYVFRDIVEQVLIKLVASAWPTLGWPESILTPWHPVARVLTSFTRKLASVRPLSWAAKKSRKINLESAPRLFFFNLFFYCYAFVWHLLHSYTLRNQYFKFFLHVYVKTKFT